MEKQKTTDITELGPREAENLDKARKHLKNTALLTDDIESLYLGITPLVKFPAGDIDSPDQLRLATHLACNQLMMSRMLFTKSVIAALRMYQGDALAHLRRAIETCAFTVRMSKHRDLCRIWFDASFDDKKYNAYRKAFRSEDVYPKQGHADFNPLLVALKDAADLASKKLHGSIYGSADHFQLVPEGTNTPTTGNINFFDMPPESLPSTYLRIVTTHMMILELYGQVFQPHLTDFAKWKAEYNIVKERVDRHVALWAPTIRAWNQARNTKRDI